MTLWTRSLWRRHRAASVVLAIIVGLAVAVPAALWGAARRSAPAADDFLAYSEGPDLVLLFCPSDFDPEAPSIEACLMHDQEEELGFVRSLPEVEEAGRASWSIVRGGASADPASWKPLSVVGMLDRVAAPTAFGRPVVVSGRLADPAASDELVVTEAAARELGLGPNDQVWSQPIDELDADAPQEAAASTVTGIVRTASELIPVRAEGALAVSIPAFLAGPAWVAAHPASFVGETYIGVRFRAGAGAEDLLATLEERPQVFNSGTPIDAAVLGTLRQAVAYEHRATTVVALMSALAVVLFAGQAVARQARRESADRRVLESIGVTSGQVSSATVTRWAPVAGASAVVAAIAVVLASIAGPVGLARRGPWAHGVHVDVVTTVVASAASLLLVVAGALVGARRRRGVTNTRRRAVVTPASAPSLTAGVALAAGSARRGAGVPILSAVIGTGLAVAALVAAVTGATTIRRVTTEPRGFGVTWDAFVGIDDTELDPDVRAKLAALPFIAAVSMLRGDTVRTEQGEFWVQALVPVEGFRAIRPTITSGSEPVADDEIALGSVVMRREGLRLGDTIELTAPTAPAPMLFRIVGTTMVSDGYEPNVGIGGIVSPAGQARLLPGVSGVAAVSVVDGVEREDALTTLRETFPDSFTTPAVPSSIDNVERIANLPIALGAVTALLAAVTLTHALLVAVRRQRGPLAVCKALGFTRRQVSGSVAIEATLLGLAALAVGIPLGVIAGRLVWQAIADGLGLAMGAIVPLWVPVACAVGVLVVANLVAAGPGLSAGRIRTADALRSE